MAFIPDGTRWYVADLIIEISVEGAADNVVHSNLVLIEAESPEDAFQKSIELGEEHNSTYENPDAKKVTTQFRGLADLNVIHDELEHGAELSYTEAIGVPEPEITSWLTSREELGVFQTIQPGQGPNYGSREVQEKLNAMFPHLDPSNEEAESSE